MLKIRKDWSENTLKIKPTKVEVVGTEHGGEISVDEMQFVFRPAASSPILGADVINGIAKLHEC
jgi:hypothetical protein